MPLRLALLALTLAATTAGCCVLDGTCSSPLAAEDNAPVISGGDSSRGAEGAPSPNEDGFGGGCSADQITDSGTQRCATCDFTADALCGAPVEALCETRQNNVGAACQLCVSDDNTVLYDDCFVDASAAVAVASCEETPGAAAGERCTTCFDAVGNAVRTTCAPAADECTSFDDSGRACTSCIGDGGAYVSCEAEDIDPASCLAYGNDAGRCVDCFDARGGLLSHTCAPTGGAVRCEEQLLPEGLACTVCFDGAGVVSERRCEDATRQSESCARLDFSEQSCVVCVGSNDAITFVSCASDLCGGLDAVASCRTDADCGEGQSCFNSTCTVVPSTDVEAAPPSLCAAPACATVRAADGALCRVCPTSTGVEETRCLGDSGALLCEAVPEASLPPEPDDSVDEDNFAGDADRPVAQGRTCVVCSDAESGNEVYRDCDGNGNVPAPTCAEVLDADGKRCTACSDAVSGALVYSSCGDERCYDPTSAALRASDGVPLSDGAGDDATASCRACLVGDAAVTTCERDSCAAGDALLNGATGCDVETVTVTIAPRACENPWEAQRASLSRDDDVRAVMAYALERQATVLQATARLDANDAICDDSCDCPRGDVIDLAVAPADRAAVVAVFGSIVRE